MDFKVRKLTLADLPNLVECERLIFSNPWGISLKIQLEEKNKLNLGCFYRDSLVGYLLSTEIFGESELLRIGTLQLYRNQGVAKHLLSAYFSESKSDTFFLEVEESNKAAIFLYEKNGYQTYHKRVDYYGPKRNAILMKREIK